MAKKNHKGGKKKGSGKRKSAKRVAAGKKSYRSRGGLKSYNKSQTPAAKAKRSRAAKKAARTRAKHKGYSKKKHKGGKKKKHKGYSKKKKKGGKKKRSKKRYRHLSKEEARAARIARGLAKSKRSRKTVVVVAPAYTSHQSAYMAKLREKAAAARAHIPSYWAA